jgi:hypothetical protein
MAEMLSLFVDAHLAEMSFAAVQHRSGAKELQATLYHIIVEKGKKL